MGTAIIVIFVISVFATGMALYVFQHPIFELSFGGNFWNSTNVNADIKITRDALYSTSFAAPIFVLGVLALWSILAMIRKDDL